MTRRGYRHTKQSPFGEAYGSIDRVLGLADSFRLAVAVGGLLAAGLVTTFTYWLAPDETEVGSGPVASAAQDGASSAGQKTNDRNEAVRSEEMANSGWGNQQDDNTGWGRR